ncbi:MAG: hypothetical protein KAY24_17230 [Candidatus Eisenbacteria sp.]|nr:hypothetical protein [Candidatus Eisenbacteria bacterium]
MIDSGSLAPGKDGGGVHLSNELLQDLLFGLLPKPEAERSRAHLAICPDCERRYQERFAARERLRARGTLRELPDGQLVFEVHAGNAAGRSRHALGPVARDLLDTVRANLPAIRQLSRMRTVAALALVAATLIIVFYPRQSEIAEPPQLDWLPAMSADLTSRGAEDSLHPGALAAGLEAYAAQDLVQAIEQLQRAEASGPFEIIRKAYLGSALAWIERYTEAIEVLMSIDPEDLPEDYSEAHWALYVSLQNSGHLAPADSLLRVMAAGYGDLAQRAATALDRK